MGKKDTGDEILLILMFAGEWLDKNIGHEIINMFRADDGDNYIYVNPYGTFQKSHSGKIKKILLGRYLKGRKMVKIIAKADDLEELVDVSSPTRESQLKSCENITYGGESIADIFKQLNDPTKVFVSFKAKNYRKANKDIYISYDSNCSEEDDENQQNTNQYIIHIGNKKTKDGEKPIYPPRDSLKGYYVQYGDTHDAFELLNKKLFEGEADLWEEENTSSRIEPDKVQEDINYNFLILIRKEDDELSFSNLIAHYLSSKFRLLQDFTKKYLR